MRKTVRWLMKLFFSRLFIVGMVLFLQVVVLMEAILSLSEYFVYLYIVFITMSLVVVIKIVNKKDNPSYKLAWVIPILSFPIFGGLFYLLVGGDRASKRFKKECKTIFGVNYFELAQDPYIYEEIKKENKVIATQVNYLINYAGFPVYKNTETTYLNPGEHFFDVLVEELKKAEHFILMEYFIIEQGKMWDTILDVMVQKVKEGVEVRVVYDDAGTIQTLPYKYHEKLESMGVKVGVFNEIKTKLTTKYNNRDHRKITVIDGHVGFIGGVNLADEYINEIVKFGHWKDAAILIKGDAVMSLTVMFMQVWSYIKKEKEDLNAFIPKNNQMHTIESDGYVLPYGDSPLDDETVGENVYLNIIQKATDYVYINTPYLIIDNELVVALTLAAKSGVDIRIVTPHIEDKWYAHILTRAYYPQLIEAGVKVYEYTPGFMHAKTFVADDEIGVVGTINLDYRSLYLHFECGVWLYKTKSVLSIKEDFIKTLEVCEEITLDKCLEVRWYIKVVRSILRVLAPLM